MVQKSGWMWISIGLLCALIISSYVGAYYYMEYAKYRQSYNETLNELQKYSNYVFVNILIDYGNGTKEWHNKTLAVRGADVLNATRIVAEVNYDAYIWGKFVTRINGVGGDPGYYWLYYIWNSTSTKWDSPLVSSDAYILREADAVAWIYTRF